MFVELKAAEKRGMDQYQGLTLGLLYEGAPIYKLYPDCQGSKCQSSVMQPLKNCATVLCHKHPGPWQGEQNGIHVSPATELFSRVLGTGLGHFWSSMHNAMVSIPLLRHPTFTFKHSPASYAVILSGRIKPA